MELVVDLSSLPNNSYGSQESTGSTKWEQHPLSIPYLLVMGSACITGIIGNLAVFGAIILNEKLHQVRSIFLVNLAVADLWVTAVGDPISLLGLYC